MTSAQAATLHNGTEQSGHAVAEFVTGAERWGYAVSFPLMADAASQPGLEPVVVVELQVFEGSVGVGILNATLQQYLSSEADVHPSERTVVIELRPSASVADGHLMFRNSAGGGARSRFRFAAAYVRYEPARTGLLNPVRTPRLHVATHARPRASALFDVFVSHTSRRWDAAQCDRDSLARRFGAPDRLSNLPPFETLRPNMAPYNGMLTLMRLRLEPDAVSAEALLHCESAEKVVHAALVGEELVVCFDAGIATFRSPRGDGPLIDLASGEAVRDPWFAGLHTVMPLDDRSCLISSSGADAILWLDLQQRRVVRRWRLPADRYGVNYPLDEFTSVAEHYIPNDLQLAHLNCAAPEPRGGVLVSMLGSGDVGRVHPSGAFELLTSGFIGCHGVRYSAARGTAYFSDSCTGRLMAISEGRTPATLFETRSKWLHDALHLRGGLFLLTLGDRNALGLVDVDAASLIGEIDFGEVNGNVQFLSLAGGAGDARSDAAT